MAPMFEYIARDGNGEEVNGTLEAENSSHLAGQLKEKGYYVTSIEKKKEKKDLGEYFNFGNRVKINDLAVFSQQFAAMIDAGVSLVESLQILREQIDHSRLREVIIEIQEDVETGTGLAESMQKHPDVFPNLYCQLVKAGEAGGVLDQVLNKLAEHYERQDELTNMIKSALYYPLTILAVGIVVVIFLVVKVVPQFVSMFKGFGGTLPLPTRMLLGISNFIQGYWWGILAVLGLVAFFLYYYKNTAREQYVFDSFVLKIPVIGKMMKKIYISRFSSTLAILLDSGVDMLSSLAIVEDVVGNKVYARCLTEARIQVREGTGLSEPLSKADEFPTMVTQMIKVGEETGAIDEMLFKVSDFYDREVENSVEGTVSLIEPLMIVLLAVGVGFVAISIVTPMFDMFQHF